MKVKFHIPKHGRFTRYFRWMQPSEQLDISVTKNGYIYNRHEQEKLLHYGKPCIYTDSRFNIDSFGIIHAKTLKAAIRKCRKLVNLTDKPVEFYLLNKYGPARRNGTSFDVTLKSKPSKKVIEFINDDKAPDLSLLTDTKVKEITQALLDNGFFVNIYKNTCFLVGTEIGGCQITAYGHGRRVGISEFDNTFRGYGNGKSEILWDYYDQFDKWSRCNEISKNTDIKDIINELTEPYNGDENIYDFSA